jgi:transposase
MTQQPDKPGSKAKGQAAKPSKIKKKPEPKGKAPRKAPKKPDIKGPRTREKKILKETNPKGRPSKFTPEVTDKILLTLRAGNYIETSAAFAGVSKETLYAWLKQGAAEEVGPYRDFSDAVEEALAIGEITDVQRVGNAAKDDWRAAAWRLERRHSKRWGRKEHIEVTKPKLEEMSDEEIIAILKSGAAEGTE